MAIAIMINIRTNHHLISLDSILWGTIITCSLNSYNSKFEIRYFVFVIRHSFTIFIHIVVSSISLVLDSDIADIFFVYNTFTFSNSCAIVQLCTRGQNKRGAATSKYVFLFKCCLFASFND